MKLKKILSVAAAFISMASPVAFAEGPGPEWEALNKEVAELYHAGKYDRAVEVAKQALEIANKNAGSEHPSVGTSLLYIAELYDIQGHKAQAETFYKRALAVSELALGPDDLSVATILNNLADLYRGQSQYAQAEPLYKRALAILEKLLGLEHLDVAMILDNLAVSYRATDRGKEAEALEQRAAAIRAAKR